MRWKALSDVQEFINLLGDFELDAYCGGCEGTLYMTRRMDYPGFVIQTFQSIAWGRVQVGNRKVGTWCLIQITQQRGNICCTSAGKCWRILKIWRNPIVNLDLPSHKEQWNYVLEYKASHFTSTFQISFGILKSTPKAINSLGSTFIITF